MRLYERASGPIQRVGDVDVFRWESYDGVDVLPFQAMWYVVPPGRTSPPDHHPELELSVVVRGAARVLADGQTFDVAPGGAFLLDSGESHVVHNRSDTEPLVVFSAFWMPRQPAASTAGTTGSADA
jgi:quercetin dioxygenase-like cupin family protein